MISVFCHDWPIRNKFSSDRFIFMHCIASDRYGKTLQFRNSRFPINIMWYKRFSDRFVKVFILSSHR